VTTHLDSKTSRMGRVWRSRYSSVVLALVALAILSPVLAPGSLSQSALLSMLPFAAVLAIAAAGQTLVVQQAGIDLSVPGAISVSAMLMNTVARTQEGLPALLGIAVAILVPVLAGVLTGLVVSWFRVTPLVATLAMNGLLLGLVLFISGGQIAPRAPESLTGFALGRSLGIPNLVIVAVVVIALLVLLTTRTVFGRRFIAVGTGLRTSAIAGVPTTRYTALAFALAGACYGLAGVMLATFLGSPAVFVGNDYLLTSIAAVVVGGTVLTGGKGSIVASALGALFLTQVGRVISGMGAPASIQLIVEGAVLLVALALHLSLGRIRRSPARGAAVATS
jgi:ribose transport system permease protein